MYFNSRPSARGDFSRAKAFRFATISIHAPPRGATNACAIIHSVQKDFNSRPSARGDKKKGTATEAVPDFNSRPSARGDAFPSVLHPDGRDISIHAPPRGATQKYQQTKQSIYHFNSRPSARGDEAIKAFSLSDVDIFQFTPLREGRLYKLERKSNVQDISIHAPPRGATLLFRHGVPLVLFQFTPLREGRRNYGTGL